MQRDDDGPRTTTGEAYDPVTGEVGGQVPRRARRKRELTDEERAVVEERKAQRGRLLGALEALSPALAVPSDPPVREGGGLVDVSHARDVTPLLRLPRPSGRGGPGSALVLYSRDYDGHAGGEAGRYVLACVEYHDSNGYKCRTRGTAHRSPELLAIAAAHVRYAAELRPPVAAELLKIADALMALDASTSKGDAA